MRSLSIRDNPIVRYEGAFVQMYNRMPLAAFFYSEEFCRIRMVKANAATPGKIERITCVRPTTTSTTKATSVARRNRWTTVPTTPESECFALTDVRGT